MCTFLPCSSPKNTSTLSNAFAQASEDLAKLDGTFERRCAFTNADNSLSKVVFDNELSQEEHDYCTANIGLALRLPLMTKLSSWGDGIVHGCPHVSIDMKKAMRYRYLNLCARKHADAIVQSLHVKRSADADRPQSGNKKRALIIMYGLHRYYRDGWAHLQDTLLKSNPNVQFSLALLTWPLFTCCHSFPRRTFTGGTRRL